MVVRNVGRWRGITLVPVQMKEKGADDKGSKLGTTSGGYRLPLFSFCQVYKSTIGLNTESWPARESSHNKNRWKAVEVYYCGQCMPYGNPASETVDASMQPQELRFHD